MKEKTLVVLANGPSLKGVDMKAIGDRGFDTIGMNAAYRHYYRIGWWPTFFCCFDFKVTENHEDSFKQIIEDPNVSTRKFFFLRNLSDHPKLQVVELHGEQVGDLSNSFETFGFGGNTGVNACQCGICMGYEKIVLLGVDCNYVEVVKGAKRTKGSVLYMKKTPRKNPNYFFDDYQQKGDVYNLPAAGTFHQPAWEALAAYTEKVGVEVVNCSPQSTLDCFRKATVEKELGL